MGGRIKIIYILRFAPGGNVGNLAVYMVFSMLFYKNADSAKTLDKWKKWFFICILQMKRVRGKKGFIARFLSK